MLEAILIDDDTEKALLNTKKIDIYEKNKEEFIKGQFWMQLVGRDGKKVKCKVVRYNIVAEENKN